MRRALKYIKWETSKHVLFYAFAVGMTSLVNFILMIVLVRLIPAVLYAKFVLVRNAVLLIANLGGLGLSQAVIRWFYTEDKQKILSNDFLGILLLFIPMSLILILAFYFLGDRVAIPLDMATIMLIVLLVFVQIACPEIINWSRAEHQSLIYALECFFRGVLQIIVVLLSVYFFCNTVGYLFGLVLSDCLFLLVMLYHVFSKKLISFRQFNLSFVGKLIHFGWPNSIVIGSWILLNAIDRYMLSYLSSNQNQVAYYDAAYMLSTAIIYLLARAFSLYIFPVYMQKFSALGKEACIDFLNSMMRYYLSCGFFIIVLLVACRSVLFHVLFPADYSVAKVIITPVSLGVLFTGLIHAVASGLYVNNKTYIVGLITVIALCINVASNFILIPHYGMIGAAYSTLIAFVAQVLIAYCWSRHYLKIKFPAFFLLFGTAIVYLINYI